MIYQVLMGFASLILDLVAAAGVSVEEKDLEIALLRQQLRILERKASHKARLSRPQKLMIVTLVDKLKSKSQRFRDRLGECMVLVKPETVLKWHRELVRRKWTFQRPNVGGRPRLDADLEALIVRIARENPRMGYDKIQGELLKLGYDVDRISVRNVMRRHHLPPAPRRGRSSWRTFLKHYRQQILACDFFSIETIALQTLYVLFFIELDSRRVHLAGCTSTPDNTWVTQQARQLTDTPQPMRYLIHDHDTKFSAAFDAVFVSEGIEIVLTPFQAPKANAVAERWVRSVREECLNQLPILNESHLRRLLMEYIGYYNSARPHQGLQQQAPIPFPPTREGRIHRRDMLGGVIHDYYRRAAKWFIRQVKHKMGQKREREACPDNYGYEGWTPQNKPKSRNGHGQALPKFARSSGRKSWTKRAPGKQ
jgi:putative transposase